jgi:DNA-binding response OmpR family regulator
MPTGTPKPTGGRILCVEDDADYREVLRLLLEQDGYEVVTASGFEEALSSVNAGRFALYILDRKYNDGDGTELCRRLCETNKNVPIIFLSGFVSDSDVQKAMNAGARAYLGKPVSYEILQDTLERLLSGG